MTMPIIPKALFPLVPNLPGVPTLLRNGTVIADTLTGGLLGLTDALDELLGTNPVEWGIFDVLGDPIALADSVVSLSYRNDSRLSDYPLEAGAFATYNKVANPYDARVRMVKGGSDADRTQFLEALEDAQASLELFTILTPEIIYDSANIVGFEYSRTQKDGAYMIVADITLREIRNTVTVAYNTPKSVDAAVPQSSGQVQTFPVSQSVIKAVALAPLL